MKQEPMDPYTETKKEYISPQNTEKKHEMISTIVALKAENQKMFLKLKKQENDLRSVEAEKDMTAKKLKNVNVQLIFLTSKIETLQSEREDFKAQAIHQKTESDEKISELHRKNKLLSAQVKQITTSIARDENTDDNIFVVERILQDKLKGKIRYYLVHWKGYSSSEATWEREKNIIDPDIIEKYNRSKNK